MRDRAPRISRASLGREWYGRRSGARNGQSNQIGLDQARRPASSMNCDAEVRAGELAQGKLAVSYAGSVNGLRELRPSREEY